jgi:DNA-binding transcriptional ArsR family regulator
MTTDDTSAPGISPDKAFALVADETRLEILRTLAEAGEPLAFSTLFECSEYDTRSNFSYHLDKLDGHFVSRTNEGYALRQTGRRVVEAVIAGTVTEDPVVRRVPTDRQCPFCSAPIEVSYQQERVEMFCTECPGVARREESGEQFSTEFGTLGAISLPPAGVSERTPTEMLDAARVWTHFDLLANSAGVCARCSGAIEYSVAVCGEHDASDEVCDHCDRRYAVLFEVECSQCHYSKEGIALAALLAKTELLSFLTDHGLNPLIPETRDRISESPANYEEDVLSIDPFRTTFTFTAGDDALALTIDEDVSVVDVEWDRG